jgi:erythromycin esterase-like protein
MAEVTHGTHEFFQLKHSMLEFLVNEMGFTVFCKRSRFSERQQEFSNLSQQQPSLLPNISFFANF